MSGGEWNYQDILPDHYRLDKAPQIIDALIKVNEIIKRKSWKMEVL